MSKILTAQRVPNSHAETAKGAAFVAFYYTDVLPEKYGDLAGQEVTKIIALNRWDGRVGLAGGKVEKGESTLTAAIREAEEEIGTEVSAEDLELVCVHHAGNGFQTTLYAVRVSKEAAQYMNTRFSKSVTNNDEITGMFNPMLFTVEKRGKMFGTQQLLSMPLATSVAEELGCLYMYLKHKGLPIMNQCIDVIDNMIDERGLVPQKV